MNRKCIKNGTTNTNCNQNDTKKHQIGAQGASGTSKMANGSTRLGHTGARRTQNDPQGSPWDAQGGPSGAQSAPRGALGTPRGALGTPKGGQVAPKVAQDDAKMAQEGAKGHLKEPKCIKSASSKNVKKPFVFIGFWPPEPPKMGRDDAKRTQDRPKRTS